MRTDNRRKRTFVQSSDQSHLESFDELFKQISPSNYWSCLVFTRHWCNIFESEILCQCSIALLRQTLEFGSTILSRSVMLNGCRKMFKLVQLLMYRPLSASLSPQIDVPPNMCCHHKGVYNLIACTPAAFDTIQFSFNGQIFKPEGLQIQ